MKIKNTNMNTLFLGLIILISHSMIAQSEEFNKNNSIKSVSQSSLENVTILNPTRRNLSEKPSITYVKDTENIKNILGEFFKALLENHEKSLFKTFTENAVILPSGCTAKQGWTSIKKYWFTSDDASKTTITKLKYAIEDIKVDLNTAIIRATTVQSDFYVAGKLRAERNNLKQNYIIYFERQLDNTWLINTLMWSDI